MLGGRRRGDEQATRRAAVRGTLRRARGLAGLGHLDPPGTRSRALRDHADRGRSRRPLAAGQPRAAARSDAAGRGGEPARGAGGAHPRLERTRPARAGLPARRDLPDRPRPRRRGRLAPGPPRARRRAVRRLGRTRIGAPDGQGDGQAAAAGRGAPGAPVGADPPERPAAQRRGSGRARVARDRAAALRQARQPGLLRRHQQGLEAGGAAAGRARGGALRQQDHLRARRSTRGRSRSPCSASTRSKPRCRARSARATSSTTTRRSTSTRRRSCSFPRPSTRNRPGACRASRSGRCRCSKARASAASTS